MKAGCIVASIISFATGLFVFYCILFPGKNADLLVIRFLFGVVGLIWFMLGFNWIKIYKLS